MQSFPLMPAAAAGILAIWGLVTPSSAVENPSKPGLRSETTVSSRLQDFECGTYKGNENQSAGFYHRYTSLIRKAPPLPATDFVHDDVWVVEDDGTILITGNNAFDTDASTFRFVPNASGGYDISSPTLAFDPVLGTNLSLGDDTSVTGALGFAFSFFGTSWNDVHISANGAVSFGADVNASGFFDAQDFFGGAPVIAGYFLDLNPGAGGSVHHKAEATRSVITWNVVPEFGTSSTNTFQLVLRDDDSFDITFVSINSTSAANGSPITFGINPGGSLSLDLISFSDDLPYDGPPGSGAYEQYVNLLNPMVNDVALMQRFYGKFPDEFFQTVFFTNFAQTMAGFANEQNISNNVQGIGLNIFDNSAQYGSNGVLESRCNMNQLSVWPGDPTARFRGSNSFLTIMGQEAGHRWGAFMNFKDAGGAVSNMLLGRSDAHWSYFTDVDHSCLEGGNWEFVTGSLYTTPTSIDYFGDIDEYTFGLRTPEEVTETFYVSSATNDLPASRAQGTPPPGANAYGTSVTVTIDDIIAAEGPRIPAERPDKDLRQAFILVHRAGTAPTLAELDKIANFRRAWEDYFEVAVDGRFAVNTSITQTFPVAVIQGHVTNTWTDAPVRNLLVSSLERGFVQQVVDGGRYTFRYMADPSSGPGEEVTLTFGSWGYDPDTLRITIPYNSVETVDIGLNPWLVPVTLQDYYSRWVAGTIEIGWTLLDVVSDVTTDIYRIAGEDGPPVRLAEPGISRHNNEFKFIDDSVEPGRLYTYRVIIMEDGSAAASFETTVTTPDLSTTLYQNRPNPFNPNTTIPFVVPERGHVQLLVFDIQGKRVRTLVDEIMQAGLKRVTWDGRDMHGRLVSTGAYFYQLRTAGEVHTQKMVLLK